MARNTWGDGWCWPKKRLLYFLFVSLFFFFLLALLQAMQLRSWEAIEGHKNCRFLFSTTCVCINGTETNIGLFHSGRFIRAHSVFDSAACGSGKVINVLESVDTEGLCLHADALFNRQLFGNLATFSWVSWGRSSLRGGKTPGYANISLKPWQGPLDEYLIIPL